MTKDEIEQLIYKLRNCVNEDLDGPAFDASDLLEKIYKNWPEVFEALDASEQK